MNFSCRLLHMHSLVLANQEDLYSSALGRYWTKQEGLPRAIDDRNGWWEKAKRIHIISMMMIFVIEDFSKKLVGVLLCVIFFLWVKARSRRYPTWTITDADYTDDRALLANTPAQVESLLHSLEQAAGSICLYVNAD